MRNAVAAILVSFILLVCLFAGLGGSFDRQFWVTSLPGLMQNLATLAAAILIFDTIFKSERLDKLEQTNVSQSGFVLFLNNRMAFKILKHLGLAAEEEISKDPEMNFDFALDRLRTIDLPEVFYEKLMQSENKEVFSDGLEKMLSEETAGISKAVDKIYPRPDPELELAEEQMLFSIGSVGALAMLCKAYREANAQLAEKDQLKPEHLNLLIKIAYGQIGAELLRIQESVINLSEKAKANKLFLSFE